MRETIGVYVDPRADDRRVFHLLLVDDEPEILAVLKRLLEIEMRDVRITTAERGAEALQHIRQGRVDLIVTDQTMPGMRGIDMLRQARALEPGIRAILMTAHADLDLALAALNEQVATKLLSKPLDKGAFVRAIRDTLNGIREQELRGEAFSRVMERVKG